MKNIICHGLGESRTQWEPVLGRMALSAECPNLFDMVREDPLTYELLYTYFEEYCNSQIEGPDGRINLCGLSLGGVLALDYASRHRERVGSLIVIGTPYRIPRAAFAFQDCCFHLMPERTFNSMGLTKKNAISLMRSMGTLDIPGMVEAVKCRTLVVCGGKDNTNRKSAELLCQRIKGARLIVIEKAGHQVNVDAPERLADLITHMFQEITGETNHA